MDMVGEEAGAVVVVEGSTVYHLGSGGEVTLCRRVSGAVVEEVVGGVEEEGEVGD
jgi:hypothetical protein